MQLLYAKSPVCLRVPPGMRSIGVEPKGDTSIGGGWKGQDRPILLRPEDMHKYTLKEQPPAGPSRVLQIDIRFPLIAYFGSSLPAEKTQNQLTAHFMYSTGRPF